MKDYFKNYLKSNFLDIFMYKHPNFSDTRFPSFININIIYSIALLRKKPGQQVEGSLETLSYKLFGYEMYQNTNCYGKQGTLY
jgi:hypothetical protein